MKRLLYTIALALMLVGCGSATEVGNPTGVPRTITGTIDESTIDTGASYGVGIDLAESAEMAVDLETLTVVAIPTDGTPDVVAPVESDGFFTIQVIVGRIYILEVRSNDQLIGKFSFEQDNFGNRSDYLVIQSPGDPIDLGTVRFEGGEFRPENEPRHHMQPSG